MQYAIQEIQGKQFLIAATEINSLHSFHDSISDDARLNEEEHEYYIAYGSFLSQPGSSEKDAVSALAAHRDHWLGCVIDSKCAPVALHDLVSYTPIKHGMIHKVPFAALIQAPGQIVDVLSIKDLSTPVTAFLRYAEMSPATNVLNRPGVIALKAIEKRIKVDKINHLNWKQSVFADRAQRVAKGIM